MERENSLRLLTHRKRTVDPNGFVQEPRTSLAGLSELCAKYPDKRITVSYVILKEAEEAREAQEAQLTLPINLTSKS